MAEQFRTLHTAYGLQRMAAAEATGVPINLVEMAVGDGNGNPVIPSEGQTALARELFRATVNRVFQDPNDPKRFTAEVVIPAGVGGFTLREVGVFDSNGGLFVVGNLPATYKPATTDGSYSDTVVRVEFMVANADVVTLLVDPNVTVATRTWIINNVTVATLIPGGTTDQVLAKASNADGDYVWKDISDVNVTVDMIEDKQVLAGGQTIVQLVTTTTRGLAVYIEGVRINKGAAADEWQQNGGDVTAIVLGQSYPAGTKFLGTQNEPTGSAPSPLERSQNLADVADKPTARTNLDVYNKAEADAAGQPGDLKYTARSTAPAGWLKANGSAISRTAYAALFAAIGTTYGAGDGFNTFNLPDLRAEFIRGWDDGRGIDTGRAMGSGQGHAVQSHAHSFSGATAKQPAVALMLGYSSGGATNTPGITSGVQTIQAAVQAVPNAITNVPEHDHAFNGTTALYGAGNENRPRNVAALALIKY